MAKRVVVLGAGFGGLELCTMLSDGGGEQLEVTLIDKSEDSGSIAMTVSRSTRTPGLANVMFGRTTLGLGADALSRDRASKSRRRTLVA